MSNIRTERSLKPNPSLDYSFRELKNEVNDRFPRFISRNIDTLYRGIWNLDNSDSSTLTYRGTVSLYKYLYLEKEFLKRYLSKSRIELGSNNSPTEYGGVLVPFTPARRDYMKLLYPVTNQIANSGVNVTYLVRDQKTYRQLHKFTSRNTQFMQPHLCLAKYLNVKEEWSNISGSIQQLCDWLDLNNKQRLRTYIFYINYCIDSSVFRTVLNKTKPSVIYNIHFVSRPGYIRAIKDHEQSKRLRTIIIQHGINSKYPFGPFRKGDADAFIVWGEYFKKKLQSNPLVPDVPIINAGNPKIDTLRDKYRTESTSEGVLYVPSCLNNRRELRGLREFHTGSDTLKANIQYKLHPSDNYEDISSMVNIRKDKFNNDENLYSLFDSSKVVVGFNSTALLEAATFDCVVVQFCVSEPTDDLGNIGLLKYDNVLSVCSAINKIVNDPRCFNKVLSNQKIAISKLFSNLGSSVSEVAETLQTNMTMS